MESLTLKSYTAPDRNADVLEYEIEKGWIDIRFRSGGTYRYRSSVIGESHLETLKRLAITGHGLETYINQNLDVKIGYTEKW